MEHEKIMEWIKNTVAGLVTFATIIAILFLDTPIGG